MYNLKRKKRNGMIFKINAYKIGSASAKALADALGCYRIKPTFTRKLRHVIINWGKQSNTNVGFIEGKDLNSPSAVAKASNKLLTFQALEDKNYLPIWTTSIADAEELLVNYGKIYCRTNLTSHSGNGIVIAEFPDQLVNAPLYTVNAKHKDEYRIHVFKGRVIDVQKKKRKLDHEGITASGIRNLANGWIYARSDVSVPTKATAAAIDAVHTVGLDFGAVDIGYNQHLDKAILFEINTAPGLTGTTLEKYAEALTNYLGEL
jgi:hypothetical protein